MAEFECALLLERQREGIAVGKTKGVYKGRVPSLTDVQAADVDLRMADGGFASTLGREYGGSRATVYNTRWTKEDIIAVDDLFRRHGMRMLDAHHPEVISLADQLRRTPKAVNARMNNLRVAHIERGCYPGKTWHSPSSIAR